MKAKTGPKTPLPPRRRLKPVKYHNKAIKAKLEDLASYADLEKVFKCSSNCMRNWFWSKQIPAERARQIYDAFPETFDLWELRPDLWKKEEMR